MNFAPITPVAGLYQANFTSVVDTTARVKTGVIVSAIDNYWGGAEFIYGKATAGIRMGGVCTYTVALVSGALETQMTESAKTASSGRSLCFAMATMTTGQFGWFAIFGTVPCSLSGSTTTAGQPIGLLGTGGQVGATSATFAILGAQTVFPASTTVVKANCSGIAGQTIITIPDGEGWFVGVTLTGTGVGASAKVVSISPDQKTCVVDVANAAAVTGSVTATYTGFIVANISRPTGTQP